MGDKQAKKVDKYRTKCFINDDIRINAHMRAIYKSIGKTEQANELYRKRWKLNIQDLDKKLYKTTTPVIPFPHRTKSVKHFGFDRDDLSYA